MNLHPEYIRDLHSHYMVLKGKREGNPNYSAKMLMNNSIMGLLHTELRYMDSLDLYYYNITVKKTIKDIYESKSLDYSMTHKIIKELFQIIEDSGEFLLEENDFILNQEFIFLDAKDKIYLCYLPGFSQNILEQLSDFFEYIMNKIDYKDEAAVRLIYALYKESRDRESTFYKLYEVMEYQYTAKMENRNVTDESEVNCYTEITNKSQTQGKETIKQDKNEVVNDREVLYFGTISYVMAGSSIMVGIIVLIIVYLTGVVNNTFGTGVDSVKFFACVLVVICAEIYIVFKIFDPNKKMTKMETVLEYISEKELDLNSSNTSFKNNYIHESLSGENPVSLQNTKENKTESDDERTQVLWDNNGNIQEEKTQVLSYLGNTKSYYLTPIKTKITGTNQLIKIKIIEYPFYIGKNFATSNLVLEDQLISRRHGVITRLDDKILYTDLGSTNGTFINGIKLEGNKAYSLTPHDEISFANIKYLLEELEGE